MIGLLILVEMEYSSGARRCLPILRWLSNRKARPSRREVKTIIAFRQMRWMLWFDKQRSTRWPAADWGMKDEAATDNETNTGGTCGTRRVPPWRTPQKSGMTHGAAGLATAQHEGCVYWVQHKRRCLLIKSSPDFITDRNFINDSLQRRWIVSTILLL